MAVNARCNSYRQRRAQGLGMKDQKGIEGESDVFFSSGIRSCPMAEAGLYRQVCTSGSASSNLKV